ncbi:sensor histidine kinase [Nostocoides jenkinsii]|uniref:histidine kinase n=1 Tax=Nostocoides jenkinsii Ben 74 TaxID=1193518 RepID=A0A077M849_9MICO|nr:PAS domain-containing sensor histidine kinase [Tetrasphaera jenkinsii]CCI53471.1 putative sensor histidine kinase pdtaS [Tetrasphaera jenkinsii Ben 74]
MAGTFGDRLRTETTLGEASIHWLQLLMSDWQLLADLSYADLVLWVLTRDGRWRAVGHVRPTTGQMVFFEDIVGRDAVGDRRGLLERAVAEGSMVRRGAPVLDQDQAVREEAIPVRAGGEVAGVVTRHTNLSTIPTPSRLELSYQALAGHLVRMLATGEWPQSGAPTGFRRGAPRVSDGLVHLNPDGVVLYATPNALSAVHRLGHTGDVIGEVFAQVILGVMNDTGPVDESLAIVLTGRAAWRSEVQTRSGAVAVRAIPITENNNRIGAIVLIRDVSDLRRRESELLSKDATIREIHHRVKNNLQTVAALLRLQARRLPDGAGRDALAEAVRRVSAIAVVHETLSLGFDETVDFDDVVRRSQRMVVEVATTSEQPIASEVHGTFGRVRAEDAMALALIMSELIQNAAEHALRETGGLLRISAHREHAPEGDVLEVSICDDGTGLPSGFRPSMAGLGTQIVVSLVSDLRGVIRWEENHPRGTCVRFSARLRSLDSADE